MDYGNSPYSTVTLGNGFGGLARSHSLARSSSLRNSTGSIGNPGGGGFTFDAAGGARASGGGAGGYGGAGGAGAGAGPGYSRTNGADPYGRPSSGRGGAGMQQLGGGGYAGSGGGMASGRISNSGGAPLYSGAGGMVAGEEPGGVPGPGQARQTHGGARNLQRMRNMVNDNIDKRQAGLTCTRGRVSFLHLVTAALTRSPLNAHSPRTRLQAPLSGGPAPRAAGRRPRRRRARCRSHSASRRWGEAGRGPLGRCGGRVGRGCLPEPKV